jgi:hypothetical protein
MPLLVAVLGVAGVFTDCKIFRQNQVPQPVKSIRDIVPIELTPNGVQHVVARRGPWTPEARPRRVWKAAIGVAGG